MVTESEAIVPREAPTNIGGIEYPDEVIRALLERRLVVFAGAGVSMDPPTSLPSFGGLIREFEKQTGVRCEPRESFDSYLGRLKSERKVNVNAMVVEQLSHPRPNENHLNLLRLFGSAEDVRLVTTNFDRMFEQACGPIGWSVESFTAPLLPSATDFKGIVHLHGSLEDPQRMVLTDTDLGIAYLSEGWANRFLSELVHRYTVLFVGYSSSDLMPRYLLSAIREASEGNLYMLHPSGEQPKVQQIGIHPVPYDQASTDDHSVLSRSLVRLGTLFSQDLPEWRSSIEGAVARGNPDQPSDEEVVRLALRRPETTRFFVIAADHLSWVRWLDANGYLSPIFAGGELEPADRSLSYLVARLCVRDDPKYLVGLLEHHGFEMSDRLWRQLTGVIRDTATTDVSLAQWLTILLKHPTQRMEWFALSSLADACKVHNDADALLLLYEFLVTPRWVGSLHQWSASDSCVSIMEGVPHQSAGRLALECCADMLDTQSELILKQALEIGIWSFEHRHSLLKCWGKSSDDLDPWSTVHDPFNRPVDHGQPEGFDLLLVLTQQQIHSLVKSSGDYADDLIKRLSMSPVPILRRLAVDAVRVREDMEGERKVSWLMELTRFCDVELVSEISRLLEAIFSELGDADQDRIVKWLLDGETQQGSDQAVVNAKQSRWLWLLRKSDRNSKIVKRELRNLRRRSPRAYARPYPERPVSISEAGIINPPKPYTVDQLLSAPAGTWAEDLLSWQRAGGWMWSDERRGVRDLVRQACVREFRWSRDLARELINGGNTSTDLWQAILMAWSDDGCDATDWSSVLDALNFIKGRTDLSRDIAMSLVKFAKEAQGPELFERANRLAVDMWRENSDDAKGWMSNGILLASWNSAAGQIPMYWVEVAKRLITRSVESERITAELKEEISEMVVADSQQSTVGKVILGGWFHVFYQLDPDWAKEAMVPMFAGTSTGFEAAWKGFVWTPPSTTYIPDEMLEHVEVAITNRQLINDKNEVNVARFVSFLCCTQEPELAHRLFQVLYNSADTDRSIGYDIAHFVTGVRLWLRRMDVPRRARVWDSWLKEHLSRRKNGIPSGLVKGEVWELLSLIPVMLPATREIVDVMLDFPIHEAGRSNFAGIFHEVNVDDYPKEYARLMLYFDQCDLDPWEWNFNEEHVDKLIANEDVPLDLRTKLEGLKLKHMIE